MDRDKAVVLLSGGQDSATCLAQALADGFDVYAIAFNYGQRHRVELQQAKTLADLAAVPLHIQDLSLLSELTENALTRSEIRVEDVHDEGTLPSTFVEGRNMIFLGVAAIYAKTLGAAVLYTGVCQTDFSGYPDCRDGFVKSMQQTVSLAMDFAFEIRTPLMWLTKAETVLLMDKLGKLDWYAETHTCYEGTRPACGACPACTLRMKGFAEAGIRDPLAYSHLSDRDGKH